MTPMLDQLDRSRTDVVLIVDDVPDNLSLLHAYPITDASGKSAHVQILGFIHLIVTDFYVVAVILSKLSGNHHTAGRSDNRRAFRCGKVSTEVCLFHLQNRMKTMQIKTGNDVSAFLQRRFYECGL